jgi:hypothetical protein
MSRGGLGRNDPCPCGSGKKYKKCCHPRTFPDFSKPNAGLPDPIEELDATSRAWSRQEAQIPHDANATIDTADVGRTRALCAPLPPSGDTLPGTLAPPSPLQVETKYQQIRAGNPEGATEVVVEYTYPDLFGFAEVRAVFDADDDFRLVDGRVVSVLDLFRGMQVQMSRGRVGTIRGNPERRYDIPIAPLPDKNGLWSSRVIGLVKHTSHEIVEFRWGGQRVQVTPGHVVWSADRHGWVGAEELLAGELIRVYGNVVAPVEGMRRIPGFVEVFGIEVEYFHNYFVGTGANAMLVHNGPEKVARPVEALPDAMARPTGPRRLEAYELEDLHGHRLGELNEMAERAMNRVGVPRELRGIRESGPQAINKTGEPFTFETAQGGRNTKAGRQPQLESGGHLRVERRGVNIDAAVLDDNFLPSESWRKATVEQRMEAVAAHELAEYQSPSRQYSWRHAGALMRSYRNPNLSEGARAIIADQIRNAIAGRDAQIASSLRPEIQRTLTEWAQRAGLKLEP